MGDRDTGKDPQITLNLDSLLRNVVFAGKPESFRRFLHMRGHLQAGLEGSCLEYDWDPQEPRLLRLVFTEGSRRRWREQTQILKTRRSSFEKRTEYRLVVSLEIDPEMDLFRCPEVGPSETVWKIVYPDTVQEIVKEAKSLWSQRTF